MEDFDDGDAGDAEEVGGVGGEEAGLDDAEDLENEGDGGAADADVEAGVEEVILIFEKAEFEGGVAGAGLDLADAADADPVDRNLDREEEDQGDDIGRFHGETGAFFHFNGGAGQGETQSVGGQGFGVS